MRQRIKTAWNSPSITTWASLALRAGGAILTYPLILSHFSPAETGFWLLLNSLNALVLLLDFGIGPTLSREVAYASVDQGANLSKTDTRPISDHRTIYLATKTIYSWLSIGAIGVILCFGTPLMASPIAALPHSDLGWKIWVLWVCLSPLSLLNNGLFSLLQGAGHIAVVRRWDAVFMGCGVLTTAVIVLSKGGLLGLALNAQFWTIASLVRARVLLVKYCGKAMLVGKTDKSAANATLVALWPQAWRYGLGSLLYSGCLQACGFVLAQFAAPRSLATFLLSIQILNIVKTSSQAPFYSRIPELSKLHFAGQTPKFMSIAARGLNQSYWLLVLPLLLIGLCGPKLLTLVGSKTPLAGSVLWSTLALGSFLERTGGACQSLLACANIVLAHIAAIGFMIAFCIVIWWMPKHESITYAIAILIGHLTFFLPYSLISSAKVLGKNSWQFNYRAARFPILVLLAGSGLSFGF